MTLFEWSFEAIGTRWQIDTVEPLSPAVVDRVRERIERFDRDYSRFRSDSLASRLRDAGRRVDFPDDAAPLFALYDTLYALSGGAVTPFIGGALEELGYGPGYSFTAHPPGARLASPSWPSARVEGMPSTLVTDEPVVLDIGAAGKGHLVDIVATLLRGVGISSFSIDASGDMIATDLEQRVGLEHPYDPTRAVGIALPGERALCASASNRRSWGERLHHVVDGRTGRPVDTIVASWVIAETALVADGLATALFFTEPSVLAESFAFDYLRMFSDGRAQYSRSFPGEIFVSPQ